MNDYHKLFVAKNKTTGRYRKHDTARLYGMKDWMDYKNPSIEEVIEQLDFLNDYYPTQSETDEINEAGLWNEWEIEKYSKYFPNVEFIKVTIGITSR